jgi:hypothetical protein
MKKSKKLIEWEVEVCFNTLPGKDTNKFMALLEDRIYDIIDEIASENDHMSVIRFKP